MTRNMEPITISPEMIGAYIEGKLAGDELKNFEKLIGSDHELSNMVDDIVGLEVDMEASINEDYPDFMNSFELPLVADIDIVDSLDVVDYEVEVMPDDSPVQHINTNDDVMIDDKINTLEDTDHTFDTNHGDASDISSGIE